MVSLIRAMSAAIAEKPHAKVHIKVHPNIHSGIRFLQTIPQPHTNRPSDIFGTIDVIIRQQGKFCNREVF